MKKLTFIFIALVVSAAGAWGQKKKSPTPPPAAPEMVLIKGGTFAMGSPISAEFRFTNETQHQVTLSSFYMGKYEVTQKEWREVMGMDNIRGGDTLPKDSVSWYDTVEYCNALSLREGLTPAYTIDKNRWDDTNTSKEDDVHWVVRWDRNANGYRLPTEAEWEYACRAGTTTSFYTGNGITQNHANFGHGDWKKDQIRPVGSYAPNAWGLYDMQGNLSEWCWDWYGDYESGAQTNPAGAKSGEDRVVRGGNWKDDSMWYLYSALRINGNEPSLSRDRYKMVGFGFRVARNAQ